MISEQTPLFGLDTHIIYDDFTRPGKSLVGIQALATDRLSGSLNVTWLQSAATSGFGTPSQNNTNSGRPTIRPGQPTILFIASKRLKNINTGQYEFVVFSDVEPDYMDYQSFADWGCFCTSRNLQFNGVIYELTDLWEALAPIEMAGRGKVVIRGTRYSVIFDAPTALLGCIRFQTSSKIRLRLSILAKRPSQCVRNYLLQ